MDSQSKAGVALSDAPRHVASHSENRPPGARRPRRRGSSTVLALLYLVLFAALALGFFAQTNLGAQVSANEERVLEAQVACESGLQFLRYQLSRVAVPPTVPPEQVFDEVYAQLSVLLEGTANLGAYEVGFVPTPGARAVNVPANPNEFIKLGPSGATFRAAVTELAGGRLRIKTTGRAGGGFVIARAIAMDFVEAPRRSAVLDYGVATKGTIELNARSAIRGATDAARGKVLSVNTSVPKPVDLKGAGTAGISGRVYLSHPTGSVAGSGTIAGEPTGSWHLVVHPNTPAPEFPGADPKPFVDYLVGKETLITGSSSAAYLSNIRVKAGTNPSFTGGGTYEGVILIEAPNQVTFAANSTIRGVVVIANPTDATVTNKVTFNGLVTFHGVETLSESFGTLKTMRGSSIVAPNFQVDYVGATGSVVSGASLVKNLSLSLNSVVTMNGPVIAAGTGMTYLSSDSVIRIAGDAPANTPAGFDFTHTYAPHPATYLEVAN